MKKLMSLLLILVLILGTAPIGAFADQVIGAEVYSITYQDGQVTVDGRAFDHDRQNVTVTVTPAGENGSSKTVTCGNDGRFTATLAGNGFVPYQVVATTDTGASVRVEFNMTGLDGLFSGQTNFSLGVQFSSHGMKLIGSHNGAANGIVTIRVVDANPAKDDLSMVQVLADAQSDSEKCFKINMNPEPGACILRIKTRDLPQESYNFTCPVIDGSWYAVDENEFATMVHRLRSYAEAMENKIAECEAEDIAVDYEKAYLEIIKKYTIYAEREVYYGETYRMGNFLYSLTRIYNEAMGNMNGYLAGTKRAYMISKLKSGPIEIDGTTVLANMETDGTTVKRPAFLVGYLLWDTVEEETEYLSSIGGNFIQSDLAMQEFISQIRGGGWVTQTYKGSNATEINTTEIKTSDDDAHSGMYSLKVNYSHLTTDTYRYIHQRFQVKPNTTYVYGLSAKAASIVKDAASFNIYERFTGKRQYLNKNVGNTQWQDYQFEYTTDAYLEWLDFTMMFTNQITDLYIDDVYVYEKGTTVNLLKNGTFDDYTSSPTVYDAEAEAQGWYINHHAVNDMHRILAKAARNNVAVDVILGPNPVDFMHHDGSIPQTGTGFTTFPLDNVKARTAISLFARLIASELESEPAAVSLCLINEPEVKAWFCDGYYQTAWENWLKKKYNNDTMAFFRAHGEWGFSGAYMPSIAPYADSSAQSKIKYNDYIAFNDSLLAEFHTWYAGEVKKVSDIPVHTKTMQYLRENYQNYFIQGTNYDLVADTLDVNGCDAWSEYTDQSSLAAKMAWYDLMTSTADKPVWNTEDHVTAGGEVYDSQGNLIQYKTLYNDLEPKFVSSDVWNGAVHGRGASALWCWNDSIRTMVGWNGSIHTNLNVIHKPEQVALTAKAAMDLNRLAEEVTAISTEQAKVGILYSRTSVAYMHEQGTTGFHDYQNPHMDAVLQAYEDTIYSGQKAGFITDGVYNNLEQYDLVIVPNATHVSANILNAIDAYQQGGGEVLILGSSNALSKTDANQNQNSTVLNRVKNAADKTSTVKGKIQAMGLSEIVLVDASTNQPLTDVEWSYAPYGNGYVVNVLNYNYETHKPFKLLLNGGEISSFTDLRTGDATATGVMTAKTLEPMLLEIKAYTFDLISESGQVLRADIDKVQAGRIKCTTPQSGGTLILALYEGDAMVKASFGTGVLETGELDSSKNYRLMAAYWDMETLKPMAKNRSIYQ
ncbi:MAG: hypothetical protein IKW60_01355 [Clostridia bacterium]|nr:hypothetical protein [Clostridia bacterium]